MHIRNYGPFLIVLLVIWPSALCCIFLLATRLTDRLSTYSIINHRVLSTHMRLWSSTIFRCDLKFAKSRSYMPSHTYGG